jgi:hypothetical protein
MATGETNHDEIYIKEKLTVTVDNAFLSSNWRIVISIFPFVCSIIINGIIDNGDLR